jgi:hypothetical protein
LGGKSFKGNGLPRRKLENMFVQPAENPLAERNQSRDEAPWFGSSPMQ